MYHHYIEINSDHLVISAFSDAFMEPGPNSILVAETEERHFNPRLIDDNGEAMFRWDGNAMIDRDEAERVPTGASLSAWRERKCDEVDTEWLSRLRAGFAHSDGRAYPLDSDAQTAYHIEYDLVKEGILNNPMARSVGNEDVFMAPSDFISFCLAAFAAGNAIQMSRSNAKDAMRAASNYADALAAFNAYMEG